MTRPNAPIMSQVKMPLITQFLHLVVINVRKCEIWAFTTYWGSLLRWYLSCFKLATDFGGKWERVASRISGALSVPVGMVDDKSTFFFICNDLSSSESKSKFWNTNKRLGLESRNKNRFYRSYSITVLIASFVLRFSVQISSLTSDCSLSQLGHSFFSNSAEEKWTVPAQLFV